MLLGREYRKAGDLLTAFRAVVGRLHGAFTLLAVHADEPGLVVGARRNSPLVVGLGDGEQFLGSDVAAFVEYTRRALAIGQDQIVAIRPEGIELTDFAGNPVEGEEYEVAWDASAAEKGGWSSFMAKEISEEPEALEQTLLGRVHDGLVRARRDLGRLPRRRPARRRPDRAARRAAPPRTPRCSASTRSRSGPACRSRSTSRTSSATATRCSGRTRSSPPSASPARRWTR